MGHVDLNLIALFLVLGLMVGYLGGLFGIGGGIILVPTFMYLFPLIGIHEPVAMHMALGTSVAMLSPVAMASAWKQYKIGNLDCSYYRTWAMDIAIGVILGLLVVARISDRKLKLLFAFFLLFAACFMLVSRESGNDSGEGPKGLSKCMPIKKTIAIASGTAPVVGIIGVAGFIYHGIGVPGRPTYALGYVASLVFLCMTPMSIIGAPFGVKCGNAMDKNRLKRIFSVVILIIAMHTFYTLYSS